METHRRDSLRLKGYDYSQPGKYFITVCTADRRSILGEVVAGRMRLSDIGKIVESCWKEIPEHFPDTKVGAFQIMPNHVHGIFHIKDHPVGTQHAASLQGNQTGRRAQPAPGSLNAIVRSFKSAVTKQAHEQVFIHDALWQRSFHDHIVRNDIDHFFIEQYIELNPIMWDLDTDKPTVRGMSIEAFRNTLIEEHGLTGYALERVIEYERGYRDIKA